LNTFGKLLVKLGATPPPDSEFWYGPVAPLSGSYLSQFAGDSGALRINAVNACVRIGAKPMAARWTGSTRYTESFTMRPMTL